MIITPKVRGFICTSAHPQGCYQSVKQQIDYIIKQGSFIGPKNVLIIGASTGYGLSSRIVTTFACNAKTLGVFFEKEASEKRTATAGWYNTASFETLAHDAGHYAKSINGDAFSNEVKRQSIELIQEDLGKIDLVIYSLAAPRRVHPNTGEILNSVLKPIGKSYTNKTVDPIRGEVKKITIEPATEEEIRQTVAVMGGEDWEMWIDQLIKSNVLANNAMTLAYTYIGPELTHPIYKDGTIGRAKKHLQETADKLNKKLQNSGGRAFLSVNKAVVTQASAAIPVVPLYISILFKVMKEKGTHEGCIEQIYRLFKEKIYRSNQPMINQAGLVRVDDWEMAVDVQQKVAKLWNEVTTDNLEKITDIQGYRDEFYRLFGFGLNGVDYQADIAHDVKIPSIEKHTVYD